MIDQTRLSKSWLHIDFVQNLLRVSDGALIAIKMAIPDRYLSEKTYKLSSFLKVSGVNHPRATAKAKVLAIRARQGMVFFQLTR